MAKFVIQNNSYFDEFDAVYRPASPDVTEDYSEYVKPSRRNPRVKFKKYERD